MEVNQIKETIRYTLNKNKANNIVVIDLQKKSYIADYMIIASELLHDIYNLYRKI